MTITFPALNGVVLLTVTDKVLREMAMGIVPLMVFNAFLPALFIALRARQGRWGALASCVALWAALACLLEWRAVWPYRHGISAAAAILALACAAEAFRRLRASGARAPGLAPAAPAPRQFLRERAGRIFWFFVSLALVSAIAHAFRDAHSLVGRLSALPLVPLFVLHWAVDERRDDFSQIRVSAVIGPVAAGAFLLFFTASLGLVRSDAGELHPGYWPVGIGLLLIGWELTRRLILGLARLSYPRP